MYSQMSILKQDNNSFQLLLDNKNINNFPTFEAALEEFLSLTQPSSTPPFSLSSFLLYSSLKKEFEELEECLDKIDFICKKTMKENELLKEENERLKKEREDKR